MICNRENKGRFTANQMKVLNPGQRERLLETKRERGMIINPPLKGKTIGAVVDGKYVKL